MKTKSPLVFIITVLFLSSCIYATSPIEKEIFHYFNGEINFALQNLLEIRLENDPVWNEYVARCYWIILKETEDKKNRKDLENKLINYINEAIKISKDNFEKTGSVFDAYNFIMASSTKSAFLAEKKQYRASAQILDRIINEMEFCINNGFDLVYLPLGAAQFKVSQNIGGWSLGSLGKRLAYKMFTPSRLYKIIRIDEEEAIRFVEIASLYQNAPEFRRIEALFVLQNILLEYHDRNSENHDKDFEIFIILDELNQKFPQNKMIRFNLAKIKNHLALKK